MGSDAATKTAIFSLSSSPSCMKVESKSWYAYSEFERSNDIDKCRMEWKDHIAIARIGSNAGIGSNKKIINCTTNTRALSSPSRNDIYGNNYNGENEHSDNESKNEESFSSFLSSSIGSNISKSFDWALETTSIQSCQNPFECYCLPINNPTSPKPTEIARHQRKGIEDDDVDEVRRSPVADNEDDNEEEGKEDFRPYVPFSLPSFCEYCGSPSIRNCREFNPECQRPKTFFPKANPPFGRSTLPDPL
jgi:hypothetical protein